MDLLVDLSDMADLECPVCMCLLTPPVVQCSNGHNTCPKCKPSCPLCPICRGLFLPTPNRVLDQILQKLPQPCRYTEAGCRLPVSDTHLAQFCQFRPIDCQLGLAQPCLWTGTVKDWLGHAEQKHCTFYFTIDFPNKLRFWALKYFPGVWSLRIRINDNFFFMTIHKRSKILSITFTYVPTQKPTEDFFFQLHFSDSNGQVMYNGTLIPKVFTDDQDQDEEGMRMDVLLSDIETISNNGNDGYIGICNVRKENIAK